MTAIVHRTPGLIDVRAFTTMGMSAKVTENPIGMFGTGLKYAIAVLVRMGARPVVWIGRDRYEFFCEPTSFRDKEFQLVRMRRKRWSLTKPSTHDLPFTTEYGRNWKMWMAFRELESNTRDEGGETYCDSAPTERILPREGETTIVIEHPEYVQAWVDRDKVFLPGGLSVRGDGDGVQFLPKNPGQSNSVYFRGLRAMDTPKPTRWSYNILTEHAELTEDRTLKYPHQVREAIAAALLRSDDEELIASVVTTSDEYWEHNLEFPSYITPSDAFRSVMHRRPRGIWGSASGYYARHDNRPETRVRLTDAHPLPWRVSGDTVLDANNKAVLSAPYKYQGRWSDIAQEIVTRLGAGPAPASPEPATELDSTLASVAPEGGGEDLPF